MKTVLIFRRLISSTLMIAMFFVGVQVSVANAKMTSTATLLASEQALIDQQYLLDRLDEEKAEILLLELGVSPDMVKQRVQNMTTEELAQFNTQLNELPAGGDSIIGLVILVFLILIALDLLGTTNIFPAIKPINSGK